MWQTRLHTDVNPHNPPSLSAGSNMEEVKESPFVEALVEKGFEVIYFTDPLDEYVMQVSRAMGEKGSVGAHVFAGRTTQCVSFTEPD